MKKITIALIALTMILCITLAGCGQKAAMPRQNSTRKTTFISEEDLKPSDDNSDSAGDDSDSVPADETTESDSMEGENEGAENGVVDNFHPRNADGLYVYNVQEHEIRLKTNIWDYIGEAKINGVPVQNYFSLSVLAEKLGYDELYNMDGIYKHSFDDGTYIFAGFQHDGSSNISHISSGKMSNDNQTSYGVGPLFVEPYDFSSMDYVYNVDYPVNLDLIILCVYAMEYYADGNTGDCWEDIFGVTTPRIPPYTFVFYNN